eukprot:TRINITY_DN29357_c0_g1_i1.p1 TRINITY_DN29357_c0_g1~~TRINITY_DN29357_c0_g1_i1.p1  ORF type:complete len:121 (+),score=14.45 TRINITY_DN29357_c0_g1_i1:38-400(+)
MKIKTAQNCNWQLYKKHKISLASVGHFVQTLQLQLLQLEQPGRLLLLWLLHSFLFIGFHHVASNLLLTGHHTFILHRFIQLFNMQSWNQIIFTFHITPRNKNIFHNLVTMSLLSFFLVLG